LTILFEIGINLAISAGPDFDPLVEIIIFCQKAGGVTEWLKVTVLKTVVPQGTVGSNPSSSVKKLLSKKAGAFL
jgi:hypothetical protein